MCRVCSLTDEPYPLTSSRHAAPIRERSLRCIPSTYAAEKAGCGSLVARAVGSKQPCIGFVIVSIAHRQGPIARFARRAIRMVDHAHLSGGQLHAPGALQADTLVVGQRGGNVVRLPSDLVG